MAHNKEAFIRYRIINRYLIDNKFSSKKQLAKACEEALNISSVGIRTIEGDIHDMRYDKSLGYHAPIKLDREQGGYIYEDPTYSIDKLPLGAGELNSLLFAATLLEQYQHLDLFKDFGGIVQKINDALKIRKIGNVTKNRDFIRFEKVPRIRGSHYLSRLINLILEKKVVLIKYQPFYLDEPYMVQVHPYLLKEYQFRWYLIGLNEQVRELRTYGLDRILMVEPTDIPYQEKDFEANEYFENAIGVISPAGKPPEIVLIVKKPQAFYLLTKPLHTSQKVQKENEYEVMFKFRVHPTWEFISAVLAMGREAKIIRPESLKQEIRDTLRKTLQLYD